MDQSSVAGNEFIDQTVSEYKNLRLLAENIQDIVIIVDSTGSIKYVSPAYRNLTGIDPMEMIGRTLVDSEFFHPIDYDDVLAVVKRGLADPQPDMVEFRYRNAAGSYIWMEATSNPLFDENGSFLGAVCISRDISSRKCIENELTEQLNFMQKLMDSIPNPVYYKDKEGLYQGCNEAFEAACGLTRDKIIGHTCDEVFPMDMNGYHHRMDEALLNKGGAQEYETGLSYADGLQHDVVLSRATYTNTDGSLGGMVGVILDITDRKQLEKQVMALERLNVMAEMAAGIAHEIRNPMTTARGFLQMMGHKPELKDYGEYFELIIDELDRANGIITEFLSMGKNKAVNLKMQSLNDTVQMLYPLILADALNADKNVLIKLTDVPDILMDQMDIRQLILNLVRNGLEAMGSGGIINIITYIDNGEVVLSVQDQGKGIEPEVLDKLGTPFLTTKEQGTGLGLAVCYSIAARHKAAIELDTGLTGTNFMVRFKPAEYLDIG